MQDITVTKLEDCKTILENEKMKCVSYKNYTLCKESPSQLNTSDGVLTQQAKDLNLPGKQLCYKINNGQNQLTYGIARKNKNFIGEYNQNVLG